MQFGIIIKTDMKEDKNNMTILICDDDEDIRNMIGIYLKNEGYATLFASAGTEALEKVQSEKIDLIILDIMMPGMNGIDACHKIRETDNMPILFLSAKSEENDKILGLGSGGDDYMSKPFNPQELTARVKALLRRRFLYDGIGVEEKNRIVIKDLVIDTKAVRIFRGDREIKLTKTEFAILRLLAENKGMLFSIDNIMEKVWDDIIVSSNTAMVHIRKLREKLDDDPKNPKYITTVWGMGYRME